MKAKQFKKCKKRLYSRAPLIGEWIRRKAVDALRRDDSPEAAKALVEAAARSKDAQMKEIMLNVLLHLQNPRAQEVLCRLVLESENSLAREVTMAAQYALKDPQRRALFYFLTEQWDRYEELDFDQSLLRATYEVGTPKLRQRIAEKARRAGRVEWVEVVIGGRQKRCLRDMTDVEWETVLTVLSRRAQWEELWRLAQLAPAVWSVRYVLRIADTGWAPTGEDVRAGLAELVPLATASRFWEERILQNPVCFRSTLGGDDAWVGGLVISPDGRVLASGHYKAVRLWQLPDGEALRTLEGHQKGIWCLSVSLDGQVLVSGGEDGTIQLWRLSDGKALQSINGHQGKVYCLALSPDGRMLASGGRDGTVRLWRLPDGEPLQTISILGRKSISCLTVSPDGSMLVCGEREGTVQLWRLSDGKFLQGLKGHTSDVSCLAMSPDGRDLATGDYKGIIRLWNLEPFVLSYLPLGQTSNKDMMWVQEELRRQDLSEVERRRLEFVLAMMRWRRRFDVEVGEAPKQIVVGEFDIEIEG